MNLRDKKVLITGGTTGIGYEVAKALTQAGAEVFITGLPPQQDLDEACRTLSIGPHKPKGAVMDMLDQQSVADAITQAIQSLGHIDILINNAGVATQQLAWEQEYTAAQREIQINYLGMMLVTKLVLPGMLHRRSGTVVNVASTLALVPGPTQANYSASKAAIVAFSTSLRSEVEEKGISVTAFIPGLTATALTQKLNVKTPNLLTTTEVAQHMLRALADPKAMYITGRTYAFFGWYGRLFPESARKMIKRYYA